MELGVYRWIGDDCLYLVIDDYSIDPFGLCDDVSDIIKNKQLILIDRL